MVREPSAENDRPHMCIYAAYGKIRTVNEAPKFGRTVGRGVMRPMPRRSGRLICSVRETHLVCHGSLNPEVQYVYHCTTHVPYNTAYTKSFSAKNR